MILDDLYCGVEILEKTFKYFHCEFLMVYNGI